MDMTENLFERLKTESLEEVILNSYKDLEANVKIASKNIKKLLSERNFSELASYYASLEFANTQLKSVNKKTSAKESRKLTLEERERRDEYFKKLPPGTYDTRIIAKQLEVTPKSIGGYLRPKYIEERLHIRKSSQRYMWEKY